MTYTTRLAAYRRPELPKRGPQVRLARRPEGAYNGGEPAVSEG